MRKIIRVVVGACLLFLIPVDYAFAQDPGGASFAKICRACHGDGGRGGGEAPPLVPMTREVDEVLAVVREGYGQMPPISKRELTDEQVAEVVAYLKSLSASRTSASAPRTEAASSQEERNALTAIDDIAKATRARDVAALGRLYHEMAIHSDDTGMRLTKADWLKSVADGRGDEASTCQNPAVRVQNMLALVECRAGVSGVLWVLIKDAEGWRAIDRHGVK